MFCLLQYLLQFTLISLSWKRDIYSTNATHVFAQYLLFVHNRCLPKGHDKNYASRYISAKTKKCRKTQKTKLVLCFMSHFPFHSTLQRFNVVYFRITWINVKGHKVSQEASGYKAGSFFFPSLTKRKPTVWWQPCVSPLLSTDDDSLLHHTFLHKPQPKQNQRRWKPEWSDVGGGGLTPWAEHTCPLGPLGQVLMLSDWIGRHLRSRHIMDGPQGVPSST